MPTTLGLLRGISLPLKRGLTFPPAASLLPGWLPGLGDWTVTGTGPGNTAEGDAAGVLTMVATTDPAYAPRLEYWLTGLEVGATYNFYCDRPVNTGRSRWYLRNHPQTAIYLNTSVIDDTSPIDVDFTVVDNDGLYVRVDVFSSIYALNLVAGPPLLTKR